MFVFGMLSFGCILISNLVVTNVLMYLLPGIILLYLAVRFYTKDVFGQDTSYRSGGAWFLKIGFRDFCLQHVCICMFNFKAINNCSHEWGCINQLSKRFTLQYMALAIYIWMSVALVTICITMMHISC